MSLDGIFNYFVVVVLPSRDSRVAVGSRQVHISQFVGSAHFLTLLIEITPATVTSSNGLYHGFTCDRRVLWRIISELQKQPLRPLADYTAVTEAAAASSSGLCPLQTRLPRPLADYITVAEAAAASSSGLCPLPSIFNLQSLIPEKGVCRIGYAFGHNCKSIV